YSDLCGYTDRDVDTVFAPELEGLDRDKVRQWYNGYNWTGEAVYNPFDVLLLFREREFRPYWYETGNPSFLLKVLRNRPTFLPDLEHTLASYELLSTFDVEHIATEALLFQTGYLTIRDRSVFANMTTYTLDFPNFEVRTSLLAALARDWSAPASRISQVQPRLIPLLQTNDLEGMRNLLGAFFESIPNEWYANNPIARYEGYYASVFYAFFASLGLEVRPEESSNAGRLDMAVLLENRALIFEFKVVADAAEDRALAQILEKGYDRPYREAGLEVYCIGVEFSRAQRRIIGWEAQKR
ncbi:MAG: PD-(D/E)XK nuclease domain-containing protein, partial [Puniceicoccaceae bacterium]